MDRKVQLLATIALFAVPPRTFAEEPPTSAAPPAGPSAAAAPEWTSMSRAGVAKPLPPKAPMAVELGASAPPAKWAEVPLPPAPTARAAVAQARPSVAPAAVEASPPPAWAPPVYETPGAAPAQGAPQGPPQGANPNDPTVKFAADQTGVMLSVNQDLESDKVRQSWAQTGGTIQAYEANAGATFMYKDLSQQMGAGAYMSGAGLNGGFRLSILELTAPKYETRDTSWTAFKVGFGADLGVMGVTINIPVQCYPYVGCVGGPQNANMISKTVVGTFGIMKAFGSFDSPRDWSGFAVGVEWAPSMQSTTLTDQDGNATTSSSFNAKGFALNFESGSLQSMAAKMGKKAHIKVRLFMLPAVGDLPLLMTASLGAVWY